MLIGLRRSNDDMYGHAMQHSHNTATWHHGGEEHATSKLTTCGTRSHRLDIACKPKESLRIRYL